MLISPVYGSAESSSSVTSKIAIFYPEAREPYRTIYREILSGIKSSSQVSVIENILPKDFNAAEISVDLKNEGISKVIVLGRSGYKLAKKLPSDISVVSGALPIRPNGISGVSLISSPDSLFLLLEQLAPEVKTVHIAFSEKSQWLIELAKKSASLRGLELNAKKVANTGEAIQFYNQLFESGISKKDSIWLPHDKISSHDKVTLPIILEKAWSKEVVVFSSRPAHVRRGVLFSALPDNIELGRHLVAMVEEIATQALEKKFDTLKSLQLAVNLRTAAHLGLKYSDEQQETFKITFPE